MVKKIYSCNICYKPKPPKELYGCQFKTPQLFILTGSDKTEDAHICRSCLRQLYDQVQRHLINNDRPGPVCVVKKGDKAKKERKFLGVKISAVGAG